MSPARTVFVALALTAFLACEPVLEPEVSVAVSSLAFSNSGDDDDDVVTAEAELDEFNGSGIEAEIEFTDDGDEFLTIVGKAEGMDPDGDYVSLIYDIGSFATGLGACEPTFFPPDTRNIVTTMRIGFWTVDDDGEGTLDETNVDEIEMGTPPTVLGKVYVPLNKFRTISIRDRKMMGKLVACGVVETDDDDDDN